MKNVRKRLILFWLSFCSLFGAWKIVGMTVTCNRCDVMNIMWRKTNGTEEWQRKVRRWGGGGGRRERESVLSFGIQIYEKKQKKNKRKNRQNLFWIWPWKSKKASNSKHPRGWMGKLEYLGGKNISWRQCKPYDINLVEGFTAIKTQENKQRNKIRERETHTHTLSHNHTCIFTY